jgi:hypothetical protein
VLATGALPELTALPELALLPELAGAAELAAADELAAVAGVEAAADAATAGAELAALLLEVLDDPHAVTATAVTATPAISHRFRFIVVPTFMSNVLGKSPARDPGWSNRVVAGGYSAAGPDLAQIAFSTRPRTRPRPTASNKIAPVAIC